MKPQRVHPRVIIHGGAGNITRQNLPPSSEKAYMEVLLEIVNSANAMLTQPGANALDVAAYAVTLLEDQPMFNAGRGAAFTRAGTNELEASIMLSRGSRKRGVGVMRLTKVKNPIRLAREMLLRGEAADGGGAQMHCQIAGETAERLAENWDLDIVKPSYFWTRKRWDEHRKGLNKDRDDESFSEALKQSDDGSATLVGYSHHLDKDGEDILVDEVSWNGKDYLPQGTVGAVVMDSTGTICAATSTGGLTNKLPGRIGDTPTLGAGFWCEEWIAIPRDVHVDGTLYGALTTMLSSCFSRLPGYKQIPTRDEDEKAQLPGNEIRAVGMSGTGNGDSFLRTNAVRTAAAIARFSSRSLLDSVNAVAGPDGLLQQSAGPYWHKTGEGEGGIIGIEFDSALATGSIVFNFNCGGMFRAWVDDDGYAQAMVFR